MAVASPNLQAEMVEARSFMELVRQNKVSGVPHTNINHGAGLMVGSAPASMLITEIKKSLS